ncbi:pyridoxal-phosphate-dependent aminotransferase family protein [Kallotenue papyrolyticum]|uniref:pyridoxal-phosphate-dependent aminotransferase family protein n=1 Tax=Kallotenue papyrolyticum TaxID=1325125 RepID=UPI000471FBBB|nr:alanine--glyoxylate aminotransferase family protein [Kallotenue papyrolyticum]
MPPLNLRIPGPTPLPNEVREALSRPMINHRGAEFKAILRDVTAKVQHFYGTQNEVLFYTASGTGGLEAAVVNTLSPGDTMIGVEIGVFGKRANTIAERYGVRVIPYRVPWGQAADPDELRALLRRHPETKAVWLTHNETSTGVTNPMPELVAAIKAESEALILVDSVSGMAALPLPVDELGLDVVVSGSQKAWMIPPGLATLSVSERAWAANQRCTAPRFYWDFAAMRKAAREGSTAFTPAISLFYALQVALDLMLQEGKEAIYERHRRAGAWMREQVQALGLRLFADPRHASDVVTAVLPPEGVDPDELRAQLRERYNIVLAGGQGELKGKIFRIGHLGLFTQDELQAVIDGLREVIAARVSA